MHGYLMTRKIKHKHLVKVCSSSGAKISCMTDHVKPTLRDINSDHIILHAGINDLRTENTASQIAKAAIDLATSLKNDDNTVTVPDIARHCSKAWRFEQQGYWSESQPSTNV